MISLRCKMLVRDELQKMGVGFSNVDLGTVDLAEPISIEQRQLLKTNLLKSGLELLDDKKSILIEKIKNVIIEMIHYSDELPQINYSDYISGKLNHDYTYLANIFSEVKASPFSNLLSSIKLKR